MIYGNLSRSSSEALALALAEANRRGLFRAERVQKQAELRGNNLAVQNDVSLEIILTGPARTGKTFANLYKIHNLCLNYPGARWLMLRKTRESMSDSVLLTFERDVLGAGSPIVGSTPRNVRHSYRYPNGSEIVVNGIQQGGKDQKSKLLSTEYDGVYVNQVEEIMESDWQKLSTRLSNYRIPFQQLLADSNADIPTHWIYLREKSGKLKLLYTEHKDNPRWWQNDDWTEQGKGVIERLSRLTGVERTRYFLGQAAQASGLVYGDVWLDGPLTGNVTEEADYKEGAGTILWGVDDGYAGQYDPDIQQFTATSHPRVFLLAQLRPDGTICVFEEHYAVQKLEDAHLDEIAALPYPKPEWAAVDKSAAQLKGRFHARDIYTRNSPSSVEESVKVVRNFVAPDENQRRRLLVHPRCRLLRMEMGLYRRDEGTGKISKEYDHGPDALRYLLWALRYEQ